MAETYVHVRVSGRVMVSTLRSLFAVEALSAAVRASHGLDVTGCVLLHSLVNDVYALDTAGGRYALKVYRHGYRSIDEVAWELELTAHLAREGVAVPDIVPLSDGWLIGVLDAPEGPRAYAVSVFDDGAKPRPPFTDELYQAFGRLTAAVHDAADRFTTALPRSPLDVESLVVRPLDRLLPALADMPDDRAMVRALGEEAGRRLERLAARGLTRGVCHGDVTLDNVLQGSRGLALHDFDRAAPGWPVGDLTGVRATPHWPAFADGYRKALPGGGRRELTDVDLAALPWFGVAARIVNLWFHLVDKPALRGTESRSEGWAEGELTALREAAAELI
jgi:Ser/Thr protein kinase RdoA (MazF antagonist)